MSSTAREREHECERIAELERENEELKRSVFELSNQLSQAGNTFSFEASDKSALIPDEILSGQDFGLKSSKERRLFSEGKFKGHTGAVYVAKFSTCSNIVASAGFDCTVRLWDSTYPFSQVACLNGHKQMISDLAWSFDGRSIVSCSYDKTVALWDAETGQKLESISQADGLLQCVAYSEGFDDYVIESRGLVYVGSTSNKIYAVDLRDPLQIAHTLEAPAHVNALHVFNDGSKIISGDSSGSLVTWDSRTMKELEVTRLEVPVAISHLAAAPPDAGHPENEGRWLAANCYDNTIRLLLRRSQTLQSSYGFYNESKRMSFSSSSRGESVSTVSTNASSPSPSKLGRLIASGLCSREVEESLAQFQTFRGHTVKNWPIRLSFFKGVQHRNPKVRKREEGRKASLDGMETGIGNEDAGKDWAHSLVLATGSADGKIHMFDLSKNMGNELQTIVGHTDRVYCVDFHQNEPRLISSSADGTVRIWGPAKGNNRRSYKRSK